ncbi:MAG: pyruvate dehydrogenase E2 component (dihydrolipoamide acetyltransferase) [Arenicella sp.]|jgi:pyruvate dehydrogenase E2 component (dihydrolipoamide acetyltransferase)
MIKYVELTAPEASAFRQAKILSIECQEGQKIKEGDTLFRVQSGAHEINLPATSAGRIVEIIASLSESITISTALLLLETEVEGSTASTPIDVDDGLKKVDSMTKQAIDVIDSRNIATKEIVEPELEKVAIEAPEVPRRAKMKGVKQQKIAKKTHQQRALDLTAEDSFGSTVSTEQQNSDNNEVVLTQTAATTVAKPKSHSQPSQPMPSISIFEVTVPDIGADSAKVIEILVNAGDTVSIEDPLITLESDKASMDVPSPKDGVVKSISVLVDQDINEGTLILELECEGLDNNNEADTADKHQSAVIEEQSEPSAEAQIKPEPAKKNSSDPSSQVVEVRIPDIGGDSAKVIELLVNIGDQIEIEDPLVTLESDKASMDVPSSVAGIVHSIEVSVDQDISEGTLAVTVMSQSTEQKTVDTAKPSASSQPDTAKVSKPQSKAPQSTPQNVADLAAVVDPSATSHASPSIRRLAREVGVDLTKVVGSGRKKRITRDDVKAFVKDALSKPSQSTKAAAPISGTGIPLIPTQDFTKFGEIDIQPLNKIKRLTAENLHRSWLNVPHVTHNDESNISDLESFRKQLNAGYVKQKRDIKLSPLAFIVKAVVNGLQLYPQFNSSLEPGGKSLIYKKYFNIGIAVETPNGLVVPVLKDADKKSIAEIAKEMGELAKKARDKKLTMKDMSGACITISSLGGIGGTGFTPIVNAPEVAILGVSRSKIQPIWNGSEFEPGMVLPLSLSYDHRVIDGAEAARFTRHIAAVLEDVRLLAI